MLQKFIEQLSQDLGYEQPLAPNDDGSYSVDFEPDLHIVLRENADSCITFSIKLAPLPEEQREDYLLKAMIANLFGRETGGCALGLDKDGKHVTLQTIMPENCTYRDFHDVLEDFVNYAEAWRAETTGVKE